MTDTQRPRDPDQVTQPHARRSFRARAAELRAAKREQRRLNRRPVQWRAAQPGDWLHVAAAPLYLVFAFLPWAHQRRVYEITPSGGGGGGGPANVALPGTVHTEHSAAELVSTTVTELTGRSLPVVAIAATLLAASALWALLPAFGGPDSAIRPGAPHVPTLLCALPTAGLTGYGVWQAWGSGTPPLWPAFGCLSLAVGVTLLAAAQNHMDAHTRALRQATRVLAELIMRPRDRDRQKDTVRG